MSDFIRMKDKSILSFDVLPNEILLHIFDYLTSNEIIYSFIDCNQRLQHLLLTQRYHFKLPRTNLNFWNKTLPIIGRQIQTLVINTDHLTVPLDFFSNLTSMIISSPYVLPDGQLQSILNHQCFQQLHTLKIKNIILSKPSFDRDTLTDEQILFQTIFDNNNSLEVFEYLPSLSGLFYQIDDQLNSNTHIRSLTLNLIHFRDIFTLIEYTPNLTYLNTQSELPRQAWGENSWKLKNDIKLEEFYLKFKPERMVRHSVFFSKTDINQLFPAVQLFSSSLITLSLDFTGRYVMGLPDVLFNGIELENKLLKPLKNLQNFYFYIGLHGCEDVKQILSTFQTFPWWIGVHENAYLYSLPFPFHELNHFRHFENVRSNNDEILKGNHQLWCKVRTLDLVRTDRIDFKTLFPLIKYNMPKLSSITFRGKKGYNPFGDGDDLCDEIDYINNVQLNSVTTVHFEGMSIEEIERIKHILIHSFPNLQCLTLDYTELPTKENELTKFFGQKLQQIEFGEYSLDNNSNPEQKKDFSFLTNVKHVKVTYGLAHEDEGLNSRSQIILNLLTKLSKLETLSIYAIPSSGCLFYRREQIFNPILNGLDQDQIKTQYEMKYSGDYMWFIRNTLSSYSLQDQILFQ